MTLPNFSAGQIEMFFLVLLRVSTIVVMIPILGDRTTPARIKGGLAVFITFLVLPFVGHPASGTDDLFTLGLRMGGEVLIGIILGFASRLAFTGIQMAGQLVGFQIGFSIVNIIDP
ncbi:MAG: flagellar biosynthetic protein FliR, partial [Syntrophaceae bacterium]